VPQVLAAARTCASFAEVGAAIGVSDVRVRQLIYKNMTSQQRLDVLRTMESNRAARRSIEAFGETKSAQAWAADPRCVVSRPALWARVDRYGWKPEDALTTPLRYRPASHGPTPLPASALAEIHRLSALASRTRGNTRADAPERAAAADRCRLINQLIADGYGITQIARETGVSRRAVYLWSTHLREKRQS
jgi:hypothetical protein